MAYLKKIIGWPVGWALFWIGHLCSILMHWKYLSWMYVPYNNLMWWSSSINDWAGLDIWEKEDE